MLYFYAFKGCLHQNAKRLSAGGFNTSQAELPLLLAMPLSGRPAVPQPTWPVWGSR